MVKKKFFLILITLFLVFLNDTLYSAGFNIIRKEIVLDGLTRVYRVQIPASYDGKKPVPLLFVLHGGGGTGERIPKFTGFGDLCEKKGFVTVYPDGYKNVWNIASGLFLFGVDDIKFFKVMIEQILSQYRIDKTLIYAAGISNGAMMCFTLACRMSDSFAAIAAVSGNLPVILMQEKPEDSVSVLIINGTDDPIVPYNGGSIKVFGRERGRVLSTEETLNFWIKANNCIQQISVDNPPDTVKDDGSYVEIKAFRNLLNGVEVMLYSIKGGGHTWPGAVQYLPEYIIGKTNKDINASEKIWEFFSKHKKDIK